MVIWSLCSIFVFVVLWGPSGSLSSPQNMSVQFLDFKGRLHWQGPGNPRNTHYSVQLRVLGEVWRFPGNCMDIVAMECALDIPLNEDDLLENYQFRVRAQATNQSSDWNHLGYTAQPSWDTLLSAPSLRLAVKDQNVYMSLTHQQTVLPNLHFNISLLQTTGSHDTTVVFEDVESPSKRVFYNLPPGYHYCLIASANHHSRHGRHMTTKDCVYLPTVSPDLPVGVVISIGVVLLLAALIGLAIVICLQKPRDHNPRALGVYVGSVECVFIPETVFCEPVRLQADWTQPASCYHGYQARVSIAALAISNGDRQETEAVLPPSPPKPVSPFIRMAWDSDNKGYATSELLDGDTDEMTDKPLLRDRHTDRGRTPDRRTVLPEDRGEADRERDCAPDLCDLQTPPWREGEGEGLGAESGDEMEHQGGASGAEEASGNQEEACSEGDSPCSFSGYEPHPDL